MITNIGKHKVHCGSILDGVAHLFAEEKCDIFYTDPPWGQGMLKYFTNLKNKSDGTKMEEPKLDAFLRELFDLAVQVSKGIVIIEYGIQWEDVVQAAGRAAGLQPLGVATTHYRGGKGLLPMHMHFFTIDPAITLPDGLFEELAAKSSLAAVKAAMAPFVTEDGIIFDPCCGLGNTAKATVHYGMRFYGNELTDARLARAEAYLEKHQ